MTKISKITKYIIISCFFLALNCQKAGAFLPFPPTPPDIPNNVGKIFGVAQEGYHTVKSGFSLDGAMGLLNIKGLVANYWGGGSTSAKVDQKGNIKTPGQGGVKANSFLKINADSVDEEVFYNAFHTLFLTDNSSNQTDVRESDFRVLYDKKKREFQQDMAINVYMSAFLMEQYLVTLEKTINRLEQCQNGEKTGAKDCTFFGMEMQKVEAESTTPPTGEGDGDNTAQIGATRNAYIVATVQDRLLRIIEELTALEAILESSRQLNKTNPVPSGQQSDAVEYIVPNYQFAYNNSHVHVMAKKTPAIKFSDRVKACDGASTDINCPKNNKDKVKMDLFEDTSVLTELAPLEELVDSAVNVHNLKSMLYQYKIQYRQYLLQKKLHNDAKELVKHSDQCVVDFLARHKGNAEKIWYDNQSFSNNSARFDYGNRKGLSGKLIQAYDMASADITIGSTADCRGFYEENSCPAGYQRDESKCCEENKNLCACIVPMMTEDVAEIKETTELPSDPSNVAYNTNRTDTDGFMDATLSAKIDKSNRDSLELTWKLGKEALLSALQDPSNNLSFDPWNDQKILQAEYLRNKYRNIKLIIESTDQGYNSFILASQRAQSYTNSSDPISPYIKAAASCKGKSEAESAAKAKYCRGNYKSCTASYNNGVVTTKVTRETGIDSHGNPIYKTETYSESQKASLGNGCTYTKTASTIDLSSLCLTPECLVRNYFPKKKWGNADVFYNDMNKKGRIVAIDKMKDVLNERSKQEDIVYKLMSDYREKLLKKEAEIATATANLNTVNQKISNLKDKKNIASSELSKTEKRISSLMDEISQLITRKEKIEYEEDKKAIDSKIKELEFEQSCIKTGKNDTFKTNRKDENTGKYIVLSCSDYLTTLSYNDTLKNRTENTYVAPSSLEIEINRLSSQIDANTARLDVLKETVANAQKGLADVKNEYAEKYLEAETKAEKAIVAKNEIYERFLDPAMDDGNSLCKTQTGEKQPCRMKKGKKGIAENNLEATIINFVQKDKNLKSAMVKELNTTFFSSMDGISRKLKTIMPSSFVVDDTFKGINLSGKVTPEDLAKAVKDKVVEAAAEQLTKIIQKSDKDIGDAVKNASDTVYNHARARNIHGESNTLPNKDFLLSPAEGHGLLLEDLKNISSQYKDEGVENLFGIPEDFDSMENVKEDIDESYFVAMPARGNNYRNISASDKNAGRDFLAPRNMLSSKPPLREVFYFSPAEYDEITKQCNKHGCKPVLTDLLQCKTYNEQTKTCENEYLPEVWLHLLARPNLRPDKKYWQTFVERPFGGTSQLNNLVLNKLFNSGISPAPKDTDYRALIARSGIYPCRFGGRYIDLIGAKDSVGKMEFKGRSSVLDNNIPACQEIKVSGNTVTHLLADKNNTEKLKGTTTESMHNRHSELGQLLTKDLKYQPLLVSIQDYLLDQKNDENNITYQKASQASFKRNVMGSFLDAVTTEYNARKSLEQSKKAIVDTLKDLCAQFNALKQDGKITGCKQFTDEADLTALADIEKETIVDNNMKLASSLADNSYYEGKKGTKGESVYQGINCSANTQNTYTTIFCTLDESKDELVNKAQAKLKEIEGKLNKNTKGYEYLNERLDKIKGYIGSDGSLVMDKNEVTTIRPGVAPNVKQAESNRKVELQATEEGINAMADQRQATAYCPIY